jgi:hypothetical protein
MTFRLPFASQTTLRFEDFIEVFHDWIRCDKITDDVVIDVADYAHVPGGPGVLLIAHEGHYVVDVHEGQWRLAYNRKRGPKDVSLRERLEVPLRRLVHAATLLSKEPRFDGGLEFATDDWTLRILNRLHAPNEDSTMHSVEPSIVDLIRTKFSAEPTLIREPDPREAFAVAIRCDRAVRLEELAQRLAA